MAPDSFMEISTTDAALLGVKSGRIPLGLAHELQRQVLCPITFAGRYETLDFSKGYDPNRLMQHRYGVGRWDEDRVGMYTAPLFLRGEGPRSVHMGIDLQAEEGTPVFAALPGVIWGSAILGSPGDYGGTMIVRSRLATHEAARDAAPEARPEALDQEIFVLYGHLSHLSVKEHRVEFKQGELIGWLGNSRENGGWHPHLHLQMSWLEPLAVDLPGVVSRRHRNIARLLFPEPLLF